MIKRMVACFASAADATRRSEILRVGEFLKMARLDGAIHQSVVICRLKLIAFAFQEWSPISSRREAGT